MSELTVEILREIRDEIRQTNGRPDASIGRLEITNHELADLKHELAGLVARQVEMETRLATEVFAVAGAIRDLRDTIIEDRKLRETVANHEARISQLERRAG